jgi:predicted Zn finger-like uncharacterized protein
MPEIITCPRCQRKLRLDDESIGQSVQCPSCQSTFTAELPGGSPPPPPRPVDDEPPVYRPRDEDPPLPRRYDADYGRRRRYDDDEDYPRPSRRGRYSDYSRSHRGSTVQTLGILSLVFSLCVVGGMCFVGLILAIVALSMGVSDLSAMDRGEMDPSGRAQTKTGVVCAIIALVLEALGVVGFFCMMAGGHF